jgi:hypothetical protein
MSRSTQWIGLTGAASEFIQSFNQEYKGRYTTGMFEEELALATYTNPANGEVYKEVVQCVPWSSGPMIFTCLEDADGNKLFSWIEDREMRGREFDYASGRMWV